MGRGMVRGKKTRKIRGIFEMDGKISVRTKIKAKS